MSRHSSKLQSVLATIDGLSPAELQAVADAVAAKQAGSPIDAPVAKFVFSIPTERIRENALNPRKRFDLVEVQSLGASIIKFRQFEPVVVIPDTEKPGNFLLISGERRWRAAKLMKIPTLDAIVERPMDTPEMTAAVVLANVERKPLNPIEMAHSLTLLTIPKEKGGLGMTPPEAVVAMGYQDRSVYKQFAYLLELPDWCQELCETVEKFWTKGKLLREWLVMKNRPDALERLREELQEDPQMARKIIRKRLQEICEAIDAEKNPADNSLTLPTDKDQLDLWQRLYKNKGRKPDAIIAREWNADLGDSTLNALQAARRRNSISNWRIPVEERTERRRRS